MFLTETSIFGVKKMRVSSVVGLSQSLFLSNIFFFSNFFYVRQRNSHECNQAKSYNVFVFLMADDSSLNFTIRFQQKFKISNFLIVHSNREGFLNYYFNEVFIVNSSWNVKEFVMAEENSKFTQTFEILVEKFVVVSISAYS